MMLFVDIPGFKKYVKLSPAKYFCQDFFKKDSLSFSIVFTLLYNTRYACEIGFLVPYIVVKFGRK